MLKFKINGNPVAKQSVKVGTITTKSGEVFATKYTPKEMKNYAVWVKQCFKMAYSEHLPSIFYEKPLIVKITVHKEVLKSFSQKKRRLALAGLIVPMSKPDCDNIAKNICDALNGIAYPDDRQISILLVHKIYDTSPFVEVEIDEIENISLVNTPEVIQAKLF